MLTLQQVSEHNSAKSAWVIIHNYVYDVTNFLAEHPGGAAIILKYAGKDATRAYDPIHPPDALEKNLPPSSHLGPLDSDSSRKLSDIENSRKQTTDELRVLKALTQRPPINRILTLDDIEVVAKQVLSHKAWAYYCSAADDEITHKENSRAFSRFFFHARVMRRLSKCDPSTTILGFRSSLPIFVSGAALAKLGHPMGEVNITLAAKEASIIQMVSSNASFSPSEIMAAAAPNQTLFFQLYKNSNDTIAEQRVRDVEALGYKAIYLTVDAIQAGSRERDVRSSWVVEDMDAEVPAVFVDGDVVEEVSTQGLAGGLVASDDQDMTWDRTIPWLRSITTLPIVIKGIQCVEDALLAAEAGVDGILISNHGGRQLDYSLPPIEILYRLQRDHPSIFDKLEVHIDGGIRRGTDVVKALCLGAKAVGLGRPFLYAQSAYGAAGVTKLIQILNREISTTMKLVGAASVKDLTPDMVERVDWQPLVRSRL